MNGYEQLMWVLGNYLGSYGRAVNAEPVSNKHEFSMDKIFTYCLVLTTTCLDGGGHARHFLSFLLLWWNTMTKVTWGGKGLYHLTLTGNLRSIIEGSQEPKQGRNLEAGTEAEAMKEGMLLIGFISMAFSTYFLNSTQNHQPLGGSTHCRLGPATSTMSQENTPSACPQAGLVGTFSQLRSPLLKSCIFCQVDKTETWKYNCITLYENPSSSYSFQPKDVQSCEWEQHTNRMMLLINGEKAYATL